MLTIYPEQLTKANYIKVGKQVSIHSIDRPFEKNIISIMSKSLVVTRKAKKHRYRDMEQGYLDHFIWEN